ncbi:proteinase-activated receptor 1-like [Spea bombifrons]|uniref:proteinase-activated receptor 1-like n=1 Tax=Spea bombifrons TaxID=233779 RepID=UPI0023493C63|nr:proteinase-activated receptor 1-like [Spea bombifrons]
MEPGIVLALTLLGGIFSWGEVTCDPEGVHLLNMTIKSFHGFHDYGEFEDIPDDAIDESGEGSGNEVVISRSLSPRKTSQTNVTKEGEYYLTSPWLTKFIPSVYTLVFVLALPLNVMAIIIFLTKMKVRKPAVVYMLNLAVADVCFVTVLPFLIAYRFSGNNWRFGAGMCRFVTAAFYCNMYCSIQLMTSISVDRFLAVVFPMHSLSWRTVGRSWMVCILIWTTSIVGTVPLLITEQTKYISGLGITTCHDVLDLKDQQTFYVYYFSVYCLLFFFLPLITTTISYIGIIRRLSLSNIENTCKKTRALFLAVVVLCVFVICFGPTNAIFLTHYLINAKESLYFTYIMCACVSSVSCCLDPLIYYYASSQCQKYVYSVLCCKKVTEPGGSSTGHLMSTAVKNDIGSTSAKNSIYRKLLT